jgi:hypothetical protein
MKNRQLEQIVKSTIHLLMIDSKNNNTIVSAGSGCILQLENKKLLLSVSHVTDKDALTSIDTGIYSSTNGMRLYPVGQITYLEDPSLEETHESESDYNSNSRKIDFCYSLLTEKIEIKQSFIEFNHFSIKAGSKYIINSDCIKDPNVDSAYGFFGRIRTTLIKTIPFNTYEYEPALYDGLKFIEKIEHYYVFNIGDNNMQHIDFYGTSGAPIMDEKGNIVALVAHGNDSVDKIYGIAINDFLPILKAEPI